MYMTIKEMLSTQQNQSVLSDKLFFLYVWMDLPMILPSPNFCVVDPFNQEHLAMQKSLRPVTLTHFTTKEFFHTTSLLINK